MTYIDKLTNHREPWTESAFLSRSTKLKVKQENGNTKNATSISPVELTIFCPGFNQKLVKASKVSPPKV